MSARSAAAQDTNAGGADGGEVMNPFHVAVVAFLRAKQLESGARPRVDWPGHKLAKLAVREVLAHTVGWHVE
jgi:DNA-directed RNA polymerase subunit K/omega